MDCDFDLVYPMQKTFEMENKFVCKFDIDLPMTNCLELLASKL